jgi:uroporphyrinogen III methyltransferase/synthase
VRGRADGVVYLVGAGPGDPELMTLKGRRLLEGCEALVYDHLVDERVREWVRADCEQYYVGKRSGHHSMEQSRIEALLVELAGRGLRVVRLKGGDPFIFGRGGEEAEALRAAGVRYEVVPAVTAALGCAAYCGIPLTYRGKSSAVTFLSGHECTEPEASEIDWGAHAVSGATLVLYMAMGRLREISARLMEGGMGPGTLVSVVEWGTTRRQRSLRGELGAIADLVEAAGMGPPAVVIIGEVAGLGETLEWFDPAI